uniref:Ig-like domain-containing protein n=1 Tax=Anopheles minimus TaxID=112268 RepID=A0A182VTI1_9DIPT
ATAEIVGAPDLHIDEGSTLRLECKLQRATENPTYHEQNMVNFDQLNGFSVTPFQPPATAGHPSHLHPYLLPHPLHPEHELDLPLSSEEQGFNLLDDDRLLQRSLQLGQDSSEPFLPPSSSSSLLLASLAAAASALSASPYHQQHLDRTDLSELERQDEPSGTATPDSLDEAGVRHPHLHHQHHHHPYHNQHHLAMNYSDPMPYSHILTPAPSVLTIKEVHLRHAGNYTCAPSNARPTSITVHVLQGEKPAAMQHANRSQLDDGGKPSRSGSHPQRSTTATVLALLVLLPQMMMMLTMTVMLYGSVAHHR